MCVPKCIPAGRGGGHRSVGISRRRVREIRGRSLIHPGNGVGVPDAAHRLRSFGSRGCVRHEFVVARRVGRPVVWARRHLPLAARPFGCLVVAGLTAPLARLRQCCRWGNRGGCFAGSLDEPARTAAGPGDRNGRQERREQCPHQGRTEHHTRPQIGRGTRAAQSAQPSHSSAPHPPSLYPEWGVRRSGKGLAGKGTTMPVASCRRKRVQRDAGFPKFTVQHGVTPPASERTAAATSLRFRWRV